eukprot:gene20631-biopygen10123
MGLGPHPVERARSGGARVSGTHPGYMSGVGAPAVRPRKSAPARKRPPWPPACEPPQRRIIRPRTMAGG